MNVFIIGTGNVAKSIGSALIRSGHKIVGLLGRNQTRTRSLAKKFNCPEYNSISQIPVNADFYLIAVNDDAVIKVVKSLPKVKGIILHTSGTVSLDVFNRTSKKGVLYPVDSITGKFNFSFRKVPLCIEAGDETTLKKILLLAKSISDQIFILNSTQRARLHLAAVFTNNFTNHLLGIATGIIDKENLPHELLYKLAQTTLKNAFERGAFLSQTGPAKRNDKVTIRKHLGLLKNSGPQTAIYKLLTQNIIDVHNK